MRALLVVLLATIASVAHAAPPGLTSPSPPLDVAPAQQSLGEAGYRGQVLAADAAAVGLVLLGFANGATNGRSSNTTSLLELGAATFLLGAPMVHLLHDRGTRSAASIGLRVALPLLGGFLSSQLKSSCNYQYDSYCDTSGDDSKIVLGVALGVIAASVLDAVFLANGDERCTPEGKCGSIERPAAARLTATPLGGGGLAVGLAGRF